MSITLPAGLVVAPLPNLGTTCGGAVAVTPGAAGIGLSGGAIPAATGGGPGSCELTIDVTAAAAGTFVAVLAAGAVTSTRGDLLQDVQVSLQAKPDSPVAGTKTFTPDLIHGNPSSEAGASTVTITLTNPNNFTLTGLTFTDTLPTGLLLANPPNAATTCDDANLNNPQPLATSITVTDGKLQGGESCAISFEVFVDKNTANAFHDEILTNRVPAGAITVNGHGDLSNASFSGSVHIQTGAQVVKTFDPTTIASGDASTLELEFRNYNAVPLTSVSLTDNLPDPMRVASPTHAATTCAAGTVNASAGNANFSFTSGQVPAAPAGPGFSSCRVSVSVTVVTASPLVLTNQTDPSVFGGVQVGAASAQLTINAESNVTAQKVFTGTAVQTGVVTLTITLKNDAPAAATGTALTDDLTTMGAGYAVAASPAATTTCGGTLTAPPGATTIALGGGTIPGGGTCTVTVPVQIGATAALGTRTNTIPAGAIQSSQGGTATAVTASVTTAAALGLSKAFAPAAVVAGHDARLTITVTRAAGADAFTNLSFTDTLPAGHVVSATPGETSTCGGAVTATAGTGTVSLAGGALATGSCAVAVNVTTPGGTGSATNTLAPGVVTTAEGVTNGRAASATLIRIQAEVVIAKAFTPSAILSVGTSTLTVTIANPSVLALSGGTLFDLLPLGLVIAAVPNASFSGVGCAGVVTAVGGDQIVSLTGAILAAGSTCVLQVDVTATRGGTATNRIEAGAFRTAEGVTNPTAATAALTVTASADLAVAKILLDATAVPGTAVTYRVTVSNAGPDDVIGATVADSAPPGTQFTGWTCVPAGDATCTAQGAGDILDTVTIPAGGSLRYFVTAQIDPSLTGSLANTASVAPPATVVDPSPGNDSSTATAALAPAVTLRGFKSDLTSGYTPGAQQTYFVVVTNLGPSDAPDVTISDALAPGVTLAANVACTAAGTALCGVVSGPAGATAFGATGARIPAGLANRLTFTVPVAYDPGLGTDPLTNTVTATEVTPDVSGPPLARSDTNVRQALVTLAVTVTDASASYTPGGTATYTVTVTNVAGLSDALNLSVGDALPAGVTLAGTVTCVAGGSASCGTVSGVLGGTSFGIAGATLAVGPGNSLTLTVPVRFAPDLASSPLVVTATATDLASAATASSGDSDTRLLDVAMTLTKTDNRASYTPGGRGVYRLVVRNTGLSDALDVSFVDTLPPGVTLLAPPACIVLVRGSCGTLSGVIGGSSFGTTGARVGGSLVGSLIFVAPVSFAASLVTDPLVNSTTVTDVESGSGASSSDSDARAPSAVSADLSIVKTGGGHGVVGGTIAYLIVIRNAGPDAADGAAFTDVVPASLTGVTATCIHATGGATCGPVTVVTNEVSGTAGLLPKNGTLTIRVTGVASAADTLVNAATITAPAGVTDPNTANDTSTATTEVDPAPTAVPTLSTVSLVLLVAALAVTALVRQRRGPAGSPRARRG